MHLGRNVRFDPGIHIENPNYVSIGDNCWVDRNVLIIAGPDRSNREKLIISNSEYPGEPAVVHIGTNVHLGPGMIISGISAGVYISDDCSFSAGCRLYAFSNHYKSRRRPADTTVHFGPMANHARQSIVEGPIYFGENTGFALNAIVLPGVAIGRNSFVAINSVVRSGKFPPNSVIEGNPAKRTGDRFDVGTPT